MTDAPNFKKGVGRLALDRYDFQDHIEGAKFRHQAGSIDLSPIITIGAATFTDVQSLVAFLSGSVVVPTVPDATTVSKGIIRLGGDLAGTGSGGTTALNPRVSGIQGFPVSNAAPDASINNLLVFTAGAWTPSPLVNASSTILGAIKLLGDLTGGTAISPKVSGLQGFPIDTTTPTTNQVLSWNNISAKWTPTTLASAPSATNSVLGLVQLAGDFNGSGSVATAPRIGAINSATVPAAGALTTGHVLQVNGVSSLTYGFVADANVSATAAIAGSKITPNFGSQALTAGVSSLGATTTGTLTAGISTSVNALTGSLTVTTRTVSTTPFTVDTTSTDYVLFVSTASLAITVNLPVATNGRRLVVKDISGNATTNNISVVPNGAAKIEGLSATKILSTNWGGWTFVSNGTDWFMI